MEKWARTGHLITRHRGATDFHRGLGVEARSSSVQARLLSRLAVGRAKPDRVAPPSCLLSRSIVRLSCNCGDSHSQLRLQLPPCTATLPLPVQGPVTHEYHLEALPASSGLGDLSAIPERGLPLPRWDRGFARLLWPAQSFAGANPLSDSLTRPESSRRRRRGRSSALPSHRIERPDLAAFPSISSATGA